jgi:two-component system, OmpR family, sensor kinase
MIKSLRWRLQLWYAALLLTVVGGYGSILYYQTCASKLQEIDSQLEAAALYLDATLRGIPPNELDGKEPRWFKDKKGPPPPRDFDAKDAPRPREKKPPPKTRERWLADVALPRELDGAGAEDERPYFAVWRADGTIIKAAPLPDGAPLAPGANSLFSRPRVTQRGDYREARMRGPHDTRILVGRPVAREWEALYAFGWQLAAIGVGVLIVGLAGGFWLAARIFRPITAMSAAASAISATNLSTRIETANIDVELAGLARVLNAMFDRLEAAFARQQQFTADASHELRTPLAILRANAELALSQSRSAEEYRSTIETCLRAANRMSGLVQGLLTLARSDAGNPRMRFEPVPLDEVVADCLTLFKPLADEKKIAVTADMSAVIVPGDPDALAQLVGNLLSNAIQHNHAGGTIHVRLAVSAEAVLTVADTGPGIPEKDQPRIFERFYRVDKARARASGGSGLGLAICKAIALAHGGSIDFDSTVDTGTTFRVRLPRSADADATAIMVKGA